MDKCMTDTTARKTTLVIPLPTTWRTLMSNQCPMRPTSVSEGTSTFEYNGRFYEASFLCGPRRQLCDSGFASQHLYEGPKGWVALTGLERWADEATWVDEAIGVLINLNSFAWVAAPEARA